MRVRIHKNLNRNVWSRMVGGKGPVSHVLSAALADVEFRVQEGSRQRVLERKVRSVHAYCVGEEVDVPADLDGMVEVSYNPYRGGSFYRRDTGAPVTRAALVVFTSEGKCLTSNPE